MLSNSSVIMVVLVWLACCSLIGYMARSRKIDNLRAFIIPFISGIILWFLWYMIHNYSVIQEGSFLNDPRYQYLGPVIISLVIGYVMVKASPTLKKNLITPEIELGYERAMNLENKEKYVLALEVYREVQSLLSMNDSILDDASKRDKQYLLSKLEEKISELEKKILNS